MLLNASIPVHVIGGIAMTSLFPRETHPEALFQKILSQPQAKARLYETFCAELEDYTDTEGLVSRTMPYGLLRAYENQDLSAFLVGLCGNTMFDLLRATGCSAAASAAARTPSGSPECARPAG